MELGRGESLSAADIATVRGAIDKNDMKALHKWAPKLTADAKAAKTPKDAERLNLLAEILKGDGKTPMPAGM
jgi:hypothetical protein